MERDFIQKIVIIWYVIQVKFWLDLVMDGVYMFLLSEFRWKEIFFKYFFNIILQFDYFELKFFF